MKEMQRKNARSMGTSNGPKLASESISLLLTYVVLLKSVMYFWVSVENGVTLWKEKRC